MAEVVEVPLVNEYGSGYGKRVLVFARSDDEASQALLDEYGEEQVYGDHDVWSQFKFQLIDVTHPNNDAWIDLLTLFKGRRIGPSVLKRIAALGDSWACGKP